MPRLKKTLPPASMLQILAAIGTSPIEAKSSSAGSIVNTICKLGSLLNIENVEKTSHMINVLSHEILRLNLDREELLHDKEYIVNLIINSIAVVYLTLHFFSTLVERSLLEISRDKNFIQYKTSQKKLLAAELSCFMLP